MTRRLPVYILIDTSGSMKGEPIESVKVGLSDMIASLRLDPYALETACIRADASKCVRLQKF